MSNSIQYKCNCWSKYAKTQAKRFKTCLKILGKVNSLFCQKHFKISFEIEILTRVYKTFKVGKGFG